MSLPMLDEPLMSVPNQKMKSLVANAVRGEIILPTPREFDFDECLVYLNRSALEPLHRISAGCITKVVRVEQRDILLRVEKRDSLNLRITLLNCALTTVINKGVTKYVSEWFDLERSLTEFYAMGDRDSVLHNLVNRHYGLRLLVIHDLFQALCWAILGQQINLAFAYSLYARFVHTFGEEYEFDRMSYWFFPRPATIAELSVTALRQLQITGRKAEYLIGIAQEMVAGKLSKARLLALDDFERAKSDLLKVRGVGPWTANYVLLRCLGQQNAFPIEDIGLHHAIKNQLEMKRKPTVGEIRQLAKAWKNWEGYATFYLYRSLL